jgi:hypothetical protein
MPLYELMLSTALSCPKLFADDTTLPVLDPGRNRTKTERLWCYAVDDRPWVGPGHPIAAYVYAEDRKGSRPAAHLTDFPGVLQVDGYSGFKRLAPYEHSATVTVATSKDEVLGAPSASPFSQCVLPGERRAADAR